MQEILHAVLIRGFLGLLCSALAMRTDWSKRWPDAAKMENKGAKGVGINPAGACQC